MNVWQIFNNFDQFVVIFDQFLSYIGRYFSYNLTSVDKYSRLKRLVFIYTIFRGASQKKVQECKIARLATEQLTAPWREITRLKDFPRNKAIFA